jgi:hypothetical protein
MAATCPARDNVTHRALIKRVITTRTQAATAAVIASTIALARADVRSSNNDCK